jgi:cytochrome c oxidase subunit I
MLKKILLNLRHYLLIYAVGLVLLSLLTNLKNKAIDIHLHDTYFVITFSYILYTLSLFLIFLWVLYHLLNYYFFSDTLSNIHITGTLVCVVAFIVLHFTTVDNMRRSFIDFSQWNSFQQHDPIAKWYQYGTMAFIILQFLFLLNLVLGIIKKIFNRVT